MTLRERYKGSGKAKGQKKMKKQDFIELGIPEDLAEKAAALSAEELKGLVPRERLDEVSRKRADAEALLQTAQAEIEALKTGDNAALHDQIKSLQDEIKSKDEAHAAEIAEIVIADAIQAALSKTVDPDTVTGLLDREKITLSDSGKVTGLDEQILSLKQTSPFLFTEGEIYPDVFDGGSPGGQIGASTTRERFAEWMEEVAR